MSHGRYSSEGSSRRTGAGSDVEVVEGADGLEGGAHGRLVAQIEVDLLE
jgi:hypothetical protein